MMRKRNAVDVRMAAWAVAFGMALRVGGRVGKRRTLFFIQGLALLAVLLLTSSCAWRPSFGKAGLSSALAGSEAPKLEMGISEQGIVLNALSGALQALARPRP